MTDIESKVSAVFSNVFPDLPESAIPQASQDSVSQWDSIAHVTLLSAVAEEFGIELDFQGEEELNSWAAIVAWVAEETGRDQKALR